MRLSFHETEHPFLSYSEQVRKLEAPMSLFSGLSIAIIILALALVGVGLYALRLKGSVEKKAEALEQMLAKRERDMDKLKEAHAQLIAASRMDHATGAPNRQAFEEALDREWRRGMRNQTPIALILIDIDHFASFNDAVGHHGGDDCLRRVAATLTLPLKRPFDILARFAGAGFACLLPETDLLGAVAVAERLRLAVDALAMVHPGLAAGQVVTLSLGVAQLLPSPDGVAESLVDQAHTALKQAKAKGRDRIEIREPDQPASE